MRVPVAVNLKSRDGTTTKDAKIVNAFVEPDGDVIRMRSRPGNSDLGLVRAGTAQGVYYFNGQIITVHANNADRSTLPLSNTSVGSVTQRSISGITRVGATATATMLSTHGLNGSTAAITISGADQPEYNGSVTVTISSDTVFFYTVSGAPATPATGTITFTLNADASYPQWHFADNGLTSGTSGYLMLHGPNSARRLRSDFNLSAYCPAPYPASTVPGCVFLDGYFFVMDPTGTIWNCNLDADPVATWASTSFIKANKFSGAGVYLARSQNYIVALKEFSTEPFYDAGNPAPGSPLSPVANGYTQIGCASASSVAQVEDSLLWISQTRSKGRGVYMMGGSQQQKISTVDVEKILDGDDLATVYAYGMKLQGHVLYVLTLVTSNITLVYDLTTQSWCQWSSLTPQTPASITSLVRSGTTVTATFAAAHNLNDGDPLLIAGATPKHLQRHLAGVFVVVNRRHVPDHRQSDDSGHGNDHRSPLRRELLQVLALRECRGAGRSAPRVGWASLSDFLEPAPGRGESHSRIQPLGTAGRKRYEIESHAAALRDRRCGWRLRDGPSLRRRLTDVFQLSAGGPVGRPASVAQARSLPSSDVGNLLCWK
jgi:hypothetical protein